MTGKHADLIVCISIHAPPRGATGAMMKSMGIADISIHAPPRGATQARTAASTIAYFNSRPSARGDDEAGGHVGRLQISIHAPPRGATSMQYNMSIRKIISIHTPPRGATCYSLGLSLPSVFQFTPLREGRAAEEGDHLRRAFQFTPLREGRPFELCSDLLDDISIHAPPRGATTTTARACSSPTYFNSRPSARGDMTLVGRALDMQFQFTPLREGRPGMDDVRFKLQVFQFTPLREGRRTGRGHDRYTAHFNSRPSARGDMS